MRMNKSLGLILLVLLVSAAPRKLVKKKIADGITASVPDDFSPMTPEDMAQRFPSARAPLGAFTNQDRLVDFSVNISATSWPDGNAEMAQQFFKAALVNLYDRLEMINEGTYLLNKKKFFFFEFTSRISGDRRRQGMADPVLKYTYIQYYVEPSRTLVFSFSCPKDQVEEWQPVAREMMKSVKVR
jgi:hypothetical protein